MNATITNEHVDDLGRAPAPLPAFRASSTTRPDPTQARS